MMLEVKPHAGHHMTRHMKSIDVRKARHQLCRFFLQNKH